MNPEAEDGEFDRLQQEIEDITDPLVHFRLADALVANQEGDIQLALVHALLAIAAEVRILRMELQEEVL